MPRVLNKGIFFLNRENVKERPSDEHTAAWHDTNLTWRADTTLAFFYLQVLLFGP